VTEPVSEALEVQRPERPADLLQVIAQAVADPRCDVGKMERLLAMHQTIVSEQRRTAFMAAMGRLSGKLPEIGKHGTSHHGKYARLEDIDRAIRPLLAEEGLSLSFDSLPVENEKIRVICKLSHEQGHFEMKQVDLPIDKSGSKNGAQATVSTISYGRRALTKMLFNLVEEGEDTDSNDLTLINDEQIKTIHTLLIDTKSNQAKFLKLIAGVEKLEDIPARDYRRIINALDEKKRQQEQAR
jgi:ERF superfamily